MNAPAKAKLFQDKKAVGVRTPVHGIYARDAHHVLAIVNAAKAQRSQFENEWPETPWLKRPWWLFNFMVRNWRDTLGWATWWVPATILMVLEEDGDLDAFLTTFLLFFVINGVIAMAFAFSREIYRSKVRHNSATGNIIQYR